MQSKNIQGFTLLELLVVITVIVVLLAMLAPALDQAIYQAELAVCASRHHTLGVGVVAYASGNKRRYPYRAAVLASTDAAARSPTTVWRPHSLKADGRAIMNPYDDRPLFRQFMDLKVLLCPLSGGIDLDAPETYSANAAVFANYNLWFGWRYTTKSISLNNSYEMLGGMNRLGDRFEWADRRYDILSSTNDEFDTSNPYVRATHPDADGMLSKAVQQDGQGDATMMGTVLTWSFWWRFGSNSRGALDMHFLHDDLSVRRIDRAGTVDEERLEGVPLYDRPDGMRFIRVPKR